MPDRYNYTCTVLWNSKTWIVTTDEKDVFNLLERTSGMITYEEFTQRGFTDRVQLTAIIARLRSITIPISNLYNLGYRLDR